MNNENVFTKMNPIRRLIWPILHTEYAKFIPMLIIYSLITFNYGVLKTIKDALVVTGNKSGAMAIPFIKVWAILPMALLSTLIFTRLSNKYSREKVFTIMMIGFLSFFFIFAFFLYPNQDILHPNEFADKLQNYLPEGFKGLIAVFRNWTYTLFYVMSELWGTMIMTVLFWGFANEVTSVKEAGRFYAILALGANIATTIAGVVGGFFYSSYLHSLLNIQLDRDSFSITINLLLIITIGFVILFLYRRINTHIENLSEKDEATEKANKEKQKMGIRKNFSYLAKSKYLIFLALIVLSFNIALTMIEVIWKDELRSLLGSNRSDYGAYMANVMAYTGVLSTLFSLFICGHVVRKFGWTVSAYVTPVVLLISAILFFIFYLGKSSQAIIYFSASLGTSPLFITAFLGSFQNIFSRASKFTFFDVTKEMAFIPLSSESKLKGKAAIDGIGSRLGKSGGSLIHQGLLLSFGSVAISAPYIGFFIILVFFGWLYAVKSLGEKFHAYQDDPPLPKTDEMEPVASAP